MKSRLEKFLKMSGGEIFFDNGYHPGHAAVKAFYSPDTEMLGLHLYDFIKEFSHFILVCRNWELASL